MIRRMTCVLRLRFFGIGWSDNFEDSKVSHVQHLVGNVFREDIQETIQQRGDLLFTKWAVLHQKLPFPAVRFSRLHKLDRWVQ